MSKQKIMLTGIVAAVVTGLLLSPALAHRKYRVNPRGTLRWVLQRHSHVQDESIKVSKIESEPVKKSFRRRTYRQHTPGGGPARWVWQIQTNPPVQQHKVKSVTKSLRQGRYLQHPLGGGPARWVRNR